MEDISAFITDMCKIHPKEHIDVVYRTTFCNDSPYQTYSYQLRCGSFVEFYIRPINSCIDDYDIMTFNSDTLAFTEDIPVLPVDYSLLMDTILCFRIEPYDDYPGFVKIRCFGEVEYNWHCKQFEFTRIRDLPLMSLYEIHRPTLAASNNVHLQTKGPAIKVMTTTNGVYDIVECMWCPQWPKEAKNWPSRHRTYNWPKGDTMRNVVKNGCHVVYAKHPACRNDEYQHRLSFSAAEVVLLQSWTQVQQIVYHMLRFFAKRELIKKDRPKEDEVLCGYHIKTLMLWSCEEMSPEWWNSYSAIELCHLLLMKLLEWLQKGNCPNYFIPEANLFQEHMNQKIVDDTTGRLIEFRHIVILTGWFAWNYILPVIGRVLSLDDAIGNVAGFRDLMSRISEIMDAEKLENFELQFLSYFRDIAGVFEIKLNKCIQFGLLKNFGVHCIELAYKAVNRGSFQTTAEFYSSCRHYGKALYILLGVDELLRLRHTTCDIQQLSEHIRAFAWQPKVVLSRYHNFPKPFKTNLDRSWVIFLTAQDLMKNLNRKTINNCHEHKLVAQLSKELLRGAIYCDDLESSSVRDAAFVYLAALHYSEMNYEAAKDLCSTVLINGEAIKKEKQTKEETLNAACLFYIDDVATIIGFYLLFSIIKNNLPYNRSPYLLDLRLTPHVLAYHLSIISSESLHKAPRLNYGKKVEIHPLDEILMALSNQRTRIISRKRESIFTSETVPMSQSEATRVNLLPNEDDIVTLHMEYSLESMTSFYDAICNAFGIQCNVVDCYRAAFLYICRRYSDVLHLCERILYEPDLQNDFKMFAFANVMVFPPLDFYFDSDIRCLLGFQTLFYCVSISKTEHSSFSMLQKFYYETICRRKLLLRVVVSFPSSEKYHYFIGRHFLARYLKLRCMIDCNRSNSKIIMEFATLQSRLPFEHIMREFIRYKLRRHQNGI